MDHTNPFDLEVIRRPERNDEKNANEEERPGRVVFLFFGHRFVRWGGSSPDVHVCGGELRSVHFSGATLAAGVGRLRKSSTTSGRGEGG